jgi:hypothetical protein
LRNLNLDCIKWDQEIVDLYQEKQTIFEEEISEDQYEINDFVTYLMVLGKFQLSYDLFDDMKRKFVDGEVTPKQISIDDIFSLLSRLKDVEDEFENAKLTEEVKDERFEAHFAESQSESVDSDNEVIPMTQLKLKSSEGSEQDRIVDVGQAQQEGIHWLRWNLNS